MVDGRRGVNEKLSVEYIKDRSNTMRDVLAVLEPLDDFNPNIHYPSDMLFTQCIHSMAETMQVTDWRGIFEFALRCIPSSIAGVKDY